MKHTHSALCLTMIALTLACGETEDAAPAETPSTGPTAQESASVSPPPSVAGPRPDSWVDTRLAEARERMDNDAAGALVWQSIEAHGGLRGWLAASTIGFDFDYHPVGNDARRMHTHNRVDHWSARARHDELEGGAGARATFGWDGEEAWIRPDADAFPTSARFWALTPYYFVGMPFVAADPGTNYTRLPDAELDGQTFQIVRLDYEDGVGDAPDDYYVLYLHPETHLLHALRYVVSYPGFFAPGEHSPEKIMRYTEPVEVDGLRFSGRLDTSRWVAEADGESGAPGEVVTHIRVDEITLGERYDVSIFARPEGAEISTISPPAE